MSRDRSINLLLCCCGSWTLSQRVLWRMQKVNKQWTHPSGGHENVTLSTKKAVAASGV